ncbi:hypothetical protein [Trujillonella endophytica]|uniref:Uncharacterized protein n=1 Tax=Trujillonella endophytica TaxID=673521 RepID=A0A1H8VVG7_9ACTN|nr:hypothetical protein [Trujillella endophytica]SEP19273.1 hypothetical protein SAMN05660991_03800 [Trujillella endophytica]
MPNDVDPRPSAGARSGTPCTRRTAGHTPHRATILLCHTGALAEWRSVFVLGVDDGGVTLADGDELVRFTTHDHADLARAVTDAGPQAHLNTRFGYLFLASWPRDPEAVFSLCPADQPCPPCG